MGNRCYWSGASIHCKKEGVVLTNLGHLSCARNCYKSLNKVYKRLLASLEMAISLSYHKLFTIGVDSLMMLKWSHATDNQHGSIQPSFF